MIIQIFSAYKTYKDIKEGTADPVGFGMEQIFGGIKALFTIGTILGLVVVVLLGIIGYGNVLGGPSMIARIFFWIFLLAEIPLVVLTIVVYTLAHKLQKMLKKQLSSTVTVEAEIVEN